MINNFLNVSEYAVLGFVGVVFAYLLTSFLLAIGMNKLPLTPLQTESYTALHKSRPLSSKVFHDFPAR